MITPEVLLAMPAKLNTSCITMPKGSPTISASRRRARNRGNNPAASGAGRASVMGNSCSRRRCRAILPDRRPATSAGWWSAADADHARSHSRQGWQGEEGGDPLGDDALGAGQGARRGVGGVDGDARSEHLGAQVWGSGEGGGAQDRKSVG